MAPIVHPGRLLKRELAARFSKEEYTEAKSPFIEGILASALGQDGLAQPKS